MEIKRINEITADHQENPVILEPPILEQVPEEAEPIELNWQVTLTSLDHHKYFNAIRRLQEIQRIRETFRQFIESKKESHLGYDALAALCRETGNRGTYHVDKLKKVEEGVSGTYFLADLKGNPTFVIKPFDEEAGCINNPKTYYGTTDVNPLRKDFPLYHSAMREALAYQVAVAIGADKIVPKTFLAIIESDDFYDYSRRLNGADLEMFQNVIGPPDTEKLCSVQEYAPHLGSLAKAVLYLEGKGLTKQEIGAQFDQKDFEEACLLLWTTYDTDGHGGNFLVYMKEDSGKLGIKKIDNGLCFPDSNIQLRNHLTFLNNANAPLSKEALNKIAKIDVEQIANLLTLYGLESAIPAFRRRIAFLQTLVQDENITIKEIQKQLAKFEKNR